MIRAMICRRAHIGRGHILFGTDEHADLGREAARHAPSSRLLSARGSTMTPPFAPPYGAGDGALPRHPHRQRAHLIERDVRAVAQPALHRPARLVVMHAIPREHADRPIVHLHRKVHRELALAVPQHVAHPSSSPSRSATALSCSIALSNAVLGGTCAAGAVVMRGVLLGRMLAVRASGPAKCSDAVRQHCRGGPVCPPAFATFVDPRIGTSRRRRSATPQPPPSRHHCRGGPVSARRARDLRRPRIGTLRRGGRLYPVTSAVVRTQLPCGYGAVGKNASSHVAAIAAAPPRRKARQSARCATTSSRSCRRRRRRSAARARRTPAAAASTAAAAPATHHAASRTPRPA